MADHNQPGPGYYDDMRQLHYKNMSGSKMGTDIRKAQFLKANGHTTPGPGSYAGNTTFIDKTAAPKFGFGSSKREKDYIGLSKTNKSITGPGPGSYKVPVQVGKTASFAIPNRDQKYTFV